MPKNNGTDRVCSFYVSLQLLNFKCGNICARIHRHLILYSRKSAPKSPGMWWPHGCRAIIFYATAAVTARSSRTCDKQNEKLYPLKHITRLQRYVKHSVSSRLVFSPPLLLFTTPTAGLFLLSIDQEEEEYPEEQLLWRLSTPHGWSQIALVPFAGENICRLGGPTSVGNSWI